MLKTRSTMHKVNQDAYATLIAHLVKWPADAYQLVEISGLHVTTVQDLMRTFHRKGVVVIAGWNADGQGRDTTPVFALKLKASQVDVPRRRQTRAEISARYRERKERDKIPPMDPILAALHGRAA